MNILNKILEHNREVERLNRVIFNEAMSLCDQVRELEIENKQLKKEIALRNSIAQGIVSSCWGEEMDQKEKVALITTSSIIDDPYSPFIDPDTGETLYRKRND